LRSSLTWTIQDIGEDGDGNDTSYDILEAHHNRNKPSKAPLFEHTELDADDVVATISEAENVESDAEESTTSDDESEPHTRARRHSGTPYGRSFSPTQLQFYPLQWTEVLELAKNKWRLHLLTIWAFPKRRKSDTTTTLKECLTTAIADHEDDGGLVEKGMDVIPFRSHYS
jgi:hypothetical protein